MDKAKLAWCAGFFDGEGYTGVTKKHQPNINVTQTNDEELFRLRDWLNLGKVYGPYSRKNKNYSPCWYFQIYGFEKVQQAICQMWPWLSTQKRQQAKAVLLKIRGL